jgi:ribonuclease-3
MSSAKSVQRIEQLLTEALDTLPYSLRREALTHVSYANENPPLRQNERLEFLGDAVFDLAAGVFLFSLHPDAPEGDLTRMRSHLVSGTTLSKIAQEASLGRRLFLGKGELATGGREKASILAGAIEAVVGAVFLHHGWEKASSLAMELLKEHAASGVPIDSKTHLQERVQGKGLGKLEYKVTKVDGPPHLPVYTVACILGGQTIAVGKGGSKKEAEENAAKLGLESLE